MGVFTQELIKKQMLENHEPIIFQTFSSGAYIIQVFLFSPLVNAIFQKNKCKQCVKNTFATSKSKDYIGTLFIFKTNHKDKIYGKKINFLTWKWTNHVNIINAIFVTLTVVASLGCKCHTDESNKGNEKGYSDGDE